jgi:aspartyl/asparaginyl beta-hydroxylase (cupin superfamily)
MHMRIFQDSRCHPFLKVLESHVDQIREEYLRVAHLSHAWHEKALHNGLWKTVGLYQFGKWLPDAQACPITLQCLQAVPNLFLAGFSVLEPHCQIQPHVGYTHEVLRSHLGLICPQNAWIEVAGERYSWKSGEAVAFDDTQLHSAINQSESSRVVLIADFFR